MRRRRPGRRSPRLLAACAVAVGLTAGCSASRSDNPSPFDGSSGRDRAGDAPIFIEVENLAFNDIAIWAIRPGGTRIRVGRVTGKSDETLRLAWNTAQPIRFFIEQISGPSCRTGSVRVEPNARVWLYVPGNAGSAGCRVGRR